jgi:hypothetical protein
MIANIFFKLVFFQAGLAMAFYSINYYSEEHQRQLADSEPMYFTKAPDAEHVADIISRLSNRRPILHEGSMNLPSIDSMGDKQHNPLVVEYSGGRLPLSVKPVIQSSAFESTSDRGPSLESVKSVMDVHDISVDTMQLHSKDFTRETFSKFLAEQKRPVILLHKEEPTRDHFTRMHRILASTNSTNGTVPALDEFQISQYQICLWVGVVMVALVASAVCSIVQMEVIPDSLLFAKFQSTRTNKQD